MIYLITNFDKRKKNLSAWSNTQIHIYINNGHY
jgi:hypothetical protein